MPKYLPRSLKLLNFALSKRKDAGVVDRDGLENRCTLTGTQGSNPCLSAKLQSEGMPLWRALCICMGQLQKVVEMLKSYPNEKLFLGA